MSVDFRRKASVATVLAGLRLDPHAPMSAMVEIADRCNEKCVHCYQVQGQKGELDTEEWKAIFDELAEMGVILLTLSGGEATLRHDFLELVAHARKLRFSVKLFTNGLNMTPELARSLSELAVQDIQISLYSTRAEVHDWVTNVPGSWQRTVDGVRHLVAEGLSVTIKSPVMSFNADEVDDYISLAESLGAGFMLDPNLDGTEEGSAEPQQFGIDDETYLRLRSHPALVTPVKGDAAPPKQLERSVCGACSGHVHVEANGEMRPCTMLDVPVGDARRSVRSAWAENAQGRAIRELTWNDLHGCRDCDLQPRCGRCFASARLEGGDALGPYPGACRRAKLHHQLATGSEPIIDDPSGLGVETGPYRRIAGDRFERIPDRVLPTDDAKARELSWTRGARTATAPQLIRPGDLVRIRRPGAKKSKLEAVPPRHEATPD
ncbi:MAG: radical SAM protein [Myxococcota bacterium]|nr:radical SAM protein [Myxococcota bacterium]